MAGYIMNLDNIESLRLCIETGTYSTNLSTPKGTWLRHHEGAFADYLSMKESDNIYFFIDRKIYGIGMLVNIKNQCKCLNYIDADLPKEINNSIYNNSKPLLTHGDENNRILCIFRPCPSFFRNGIDMDDVLNSNPAKFKMLRAFWKLSFIKIDDMENQAIIDIILKRNEENIFSGMNTFAFNDNLQESIKNKITKNHILNSNNIIKSCIKNNKITHEMAIEANLCELLIKENNSLFGKWDYISHQVVASPFKAIDYMDKMDIFGYKYIKGYNTISKYIVIEIKKDAAENDVVDQIMKYVDWIQKDYVYGDYSMIEAYIIAKDFSEEFIKYKNNKCIRNFSKGYRPTISCTWDFVKLVKYIYDDEKLKYELIVEREAK